MFDLYANPYYIEAYINNVSNDCYGLRIFIEALISEIRKTRDIVNTLVDKVKKQIAELQSITEEIEIAKNKVFSKKYELESHLDGLYEKLSATEQTEVDEDDEETMQAKKDLCDEINAQINALTKRLDNIQSIIDSLDDLKDNAENSIYQLSAFLDTLSTMIERLNDLEKTTLGILDRFKSQYEDALHAMDQALEMIKYFRDTNAAHTDPYEYYEKRTYRNFSKEKYFFKTGISALQTSNQTLESAKKTFKSLGKKIKDAMNDTMNGVDERTKKEFKTFIQNIDYLEESLNKGIEENQRILEDRMDKIKRYNLKVGEYV